MTKLLTRETLRRLAGGRSFERGEAYAATGAVGSLQWDESSIRAGVQGAERYRVRLELAGGGVSGSCTCPVGREGLFCKHCVAVGLAWLERGQDVGGPAAAPTRSELRDRLVVLGAEPLADLLVEEALDDEYLHARLLAVTSGGSRDAAGRFRQLEHAFDVAVDPGGFVGWNEAYGFAQALEEVIATVERQLGSSHGAEIVAFCEHALRRVGAACEYVDDSNGELGEVRERLEELHLAACREARLEPRDLAERLFGWEVEGEWDTFLGAVERYADVLGNLGIARYRELAEAAWADEPELRPGSSRARSSRRYRLSQIMEGLTRAEGDVDALVAVLARDRSSPHRYLLVTEALLAAGRAEEATEWAERGLAAFEEQTDPRLVDLVCERYADSGRHDQAIHSSDQAGARSRADATAPSSSPPCSGSTTASRPRARRKKEVAVETCGLPSRAPASASIPTMRSTCTWPRSSRRSARATTTPTPAPASGWTRLGCCSRAWSKRTPSTSSSATSASATAPSAT